MTQEQEYGKMIPEPVPETAYFWEKVREHELWIQKCTDCDTFPKCLFNNP
mgnify:CR=1 FL=1